MARPSLSTVAELLKPITWFPPMWAFACGVVSSGEAFAGHWGLIVWGVLLAGPLVCASSQAVNDWFDRHVDAINEPQRPIPSGRMPGRWGLYIACLWTGLSVVWAIPLGTWGFGAAVLGLALAWAYKASSTLDSMLGYSRGRLLWLGTAGARLDDLLTWLPCRLVALGLPLAAGQPLKTWRLFQAALADGAADPSPNAGVSQAAYAHAVAVQLGGPNRYGGPWRQKPLLAQGQPPPDRAAIAKILALSRRLEGLWLAVALGGAWAWLQ